MSTSELSLDQIAAELSRITPTSGPPTNANGRTANEAQFIGGKGRGESGKAVVSYSGRFGEVLQSFLKHGYIAQVSAETGLSEYMLRRHFFGNPEFCNLLQAGNKQIFLEATKSIRDNQKGFVEKAQQLAQDALEEMESLLHESESEHIRFRVAKDLLDRDPLQRAVATTRHQSTALSVTIEAKTLTLAMEAAGELEARDVSARVIVEDAKQMGEISSQSAPPTLEQKEIEG